MRRLARWIRRGFAGLAVAFILALGWLHFTSATAESLPPLKNGDLVFQTSGSSQSVAILLASRSPFSHMGIVEIGADGKTSVIEAAAPVKSTPLADWIAKGVGGRLAVKRVENLDDAAAANILKAAHRYDGLPYDLFFLPGHDAIYCSELVELAFQDGNGMALGKMQSIRELDIDNYFVRTLIKKRWQRDPLCQPADQIDFDTCYGRLMDQKLITPASIAEDIRLKDIYSNYAFLPEKP